MDRVTTAALALALMFTSPPAKAAGKWLAPIILSAHIDGQAAQGQVLVYLPQGYSPSRKYPLIIALHGWGHAPRDWSTRTSIARLADQFHLVVACPAMGKTIYETRFYPETRGAWNTVPGTRWIGEVVLPQMRRRFSVALNQRHTAIMGYSTGGRGAMMVAQRYREFGLVVGLSGTYDLAALPCHLGEYRIHQAVLGDISQFGQRWADDDCVNERYRHALDEVRVYLAHGAKDAVVPPAQMDSLKNFLAATQAQVTTMVDPRAGHDWSFWDDQLQRLRPYWQWLGAD